MTSVILYDYVIVRPLSTVGCMSVVRVLSTVDSGITNLIHDRCSVK